MSAVGCPRLTKWIMSKKFNLVLCIAASLSQMCYADLVSTAYVLWGDALEFGDVVSGEGIASNSTGYTEFNPPSTVGHYNGSAISSSSYSRLSLTLSYFAQDTLYEQQQVGGTAGFSDTIWITGPTGTVTISFNTTVTTTVLNPDAYSLTGDMVILVDGSTDYQVEVGVPFVIEFALARALTIGTGHTTDDVPVFMTEVSFNGIAINTAPSDQYQVFSLSGAEYSVIPEPSSLLLAVFGGAFLSVLFTRRVAVAGTGRQVDHHS